ncbi:MAG: PH domain-containing protein [Proteiniphilum sp.]|jgi:uncharacterized membrane protein YdbT with pleckstrin-like domain|uniref:PH domain-containing protein n=1 Tax=Proteiniphilum sp. TaxID=1926877 RepID=UPI002B209FBD|nr:PH domain-containing protein [Proteiniphilum sp.]MEA5128310.1 PH domain-containing protein [Proteiniphilum sp.]
MGYVESNLQEGEEIKYKAKLHIFLFARPIVFLLLGWLLYGVEPKVIHFVGIFFLFAGVLSLIRRTLTKIGAMYVVTNKRVILKEGVISRQAVDLLLTKCEGLHIKQSVIGRLFNFGTITVTTGGAISSYPYIVDPLAFRREINAQIG